MNNTEETNIFLFSWDQNGIETIISFNDYRKIDEDNTVRQLKGEPLVKNPLNETVGAILLRARFNSHRRYEVYTVNCAPEMTVEFWRKQWFDYPQECADLIRDRGTKHYSDRVTHNVKIR